MCRSVVVFSALVVVAVAVGVGLASQTQTAPSVGTDARSGPLPGELRSRAPWPANNGRDLRARLAAVGLPVLAREGTVLHIHVHLDVFVNGRRVVMPAGIGIDPDLRFISPLHTHDASGVVHVESPTVRTFTLGEFFGVWGVRLSRRCVGAYCADGRRLLRVYADGGVVADPSGLPFKAHEEIVVAFGTPREIPRPVPARYAFRSGL